MRALAVLLLAVPAFADASLRAHPPRVLCSLQRTECFGWCPAYKVTIWSDGKLEYRGFNWVQTYRAATRIDPAQVQALMDAFETANFFSMRGTKRGDKDMGWVILQYRRGDRHKRLVSRDGPPYGPPWALAEAVNRIVDIDRFIGPASLRMEPVAPPR